MNVIHSLDDMFTGLVCDFEELIKWPNEPDVQRRADRRYKDLKLALKGYPAIMTDAFLLQLIAELLRSVGKHSKEGRMKVLNMLFELIASNASKTIGLSGKGEDD